MRIGLALGAGGANGLAHILMLQVFDELGLRPARHRRQQCRRPHRGAAAPGAVAPTTSTPSPRSWRSRRAIPGRSCCSSASSSVTWSCSIQKLGRGGFVSGQACAARTPLRYRYDDRLRRPRRIPGYALVATDLWRREPLVLDELGQVLPAVRASVGPARRVHPGDPWRAGAGGRRRGEPAALE
ncbi:MAG: hypothetical protein U5L11_13000 [Arhodomonas sp.]|nr:hypothetical protein [Arhodomonas sp.]